MAGWSRRTWLPVWWASSLAAISTGVVHTLWPRTCPGSSTARGGCWSARTDVHLHRIGSFDGTAPLGALLGPELGAELVLIGTTRGSVAVPALHLDAPPEHRYFLSPGQPQPAPVGTLDAVLEDVRTR